MRSVLTSALACQSFVVCEAIVFGDAKVFRTRHIAETGRTRAHAWHTLLPRRSSARSLELHGVQECITESSSSMIHGS